MKAQPATAVDGYTHARHELEFLIGSLSAPSHANVTHSVIEELIQARGLAIFRALYQGYLQRRAAADRQRAEARAARTGEVAHAETRELESLFGTVTLERYAGPAEAARARDFPLDRALNLPRESYALPVRQRVAESARSVSMEQTVRGIDRTTGAHVPKRQVEELVVRAAQDFEAFYAQRPVPANDAVAATASVVMTCDSKGITMVPGALREATRKLAAGARATSAHRDPMAPKKRRKHDKRMALVTAVYDQEPLRRTAADVVGSLARARPEAPRPRMPRPQNKTVTASVVRSQKQGIEAMFDEAERRDPEHQRGAVVLVDGEERQQTRIHQAARSRAWPITMIVDLIHVLSYVWKATAALCARNPVEKDACVTTYLWLLLRGESQKLATQLQRLATTQGLSAEARKPVDRCVRYLRKNAKYLRYDAYLAAGYPIATGVIEGACRHLVEDRMGITGARWDLASAEAVLRLRALSINGDWDAYWSFHELQHERRNARKLAS